MKHATRSFGVVFILTLAFAPALAQGDETADKDDSNARKAGRIAFDAFDANSDGKLSFEEVKAKLPNFSADRFKSRDANSDGFLTREEFRMQGAAGKKDEARQTKPADAAQRSGANPLFHRADKDGDGRVTLEEIQAIAPRFDAERFKMMDKDGDGVLTPGEAPGPRSQPSADSAQRRGPNPLFHRADKDGDGRVTLEEIQAIAPRFDAERFKMMDKDGDGVLTPGEAPGPQAPAPAAESIEAMGLFDRGDKNKDGRLSYAELAAVAPNFSKERFDEFDADKDGSLTRKEIPLAAAGAPRTPAQVFKQADKDNDGRVSFTDLAAVAPNLTRDRFDLLDRNKDGVLTEDERPLQQPESGSQSVVALVRKADTDHDGKVTFEELSQIAPNFTRERFDELDKNGDGALTEADRAQSEKDAKQGAAQAVLKLIENDSNGDGRVTFEELIEAKPGYPRETFDRLDRNKDGVLSAEDARKN